MPAFWTIVGDGFGLENDDVDESVILEEDVDDMELPVSVALDADAKSVLAMELLVPVTAGDVLLLPPLGPDDVLEVLLLLIPMVAELETLLLVALILDNVLRAEDGVSPLLDSVLETLLLTAPVLADALETVLPVPLLTEDVDDALETLLLVPLMPDDILETAALSAATLVPEVPLAPLELAMALNMPLLVSPVLELVAELVLSVVPFRLEPVEEIEDDVEAEDDEAYTVT